MCLLIGARKGISHQNLLFGILRGNRLTEVCLENDHENDACILYVCDSPFTYSLYNFHWDLTVITDCLIMCM